MQVKKTDKSLTEVVLLISGDIDELNPVREHVLKDHFRAEVKIPGFREGKAPLNIVEKHVDQAKFQNQFLEEAVNQLFNGAVNQLKIRTVAQPEIQIMKFVPYTLLEFEATVPILGEVVLPDYKKIKLARPKPKVVTTLDIDAVMENIKKQLAEKKDVDRAAKNGDQVFIDFKGVDDKGKEVNGADGKNYPLLLGSDAFIPGFEANIVGLKAGKEKTFTLKFPMDYGVAALANRDVTFTVNLIKVQEVVAPKVDDKFAAQVGPFKNLDELKNDIKQQLISQNNEEVTRDYESELLKKISDKSKLNIPEGLLDSDVEKRIADLKQNIMYRGQTWQEFLESEGKTEEEYAKDVVRPEAEERLKASIVLSEISERENIELTNEEVDQRIMTMKAQYKDAQSQADLDKPETRRDVASRMVAEKTIHKLVEYAS